MTALGAAFLYSPGAQKLRLPISWVENPMRASLMSHTLRRMQRPGMRLRAISSGELPSFWLEDRLPTPQQQADALIIWAGDHQSAPSEFIDIHRAALAATIGLHISPHDDSGGFAWLNPRHR